MENPEETVEEPVEVDRQALMDKLHAACSELFKELQIAAVITLDHEDLEDPITFWNCHFYDAAKMNAGAYATFRQRVSNDMRI